MTTETGIDLVPDQLALARAQMDAGQYGVVEGTLRRRIATLEATGRNPEELDAARALLAEALWRSGRPAAAYDAVTAVRPRGVERRRSITMMVEAEGLAAIGEMRQAEGLLERVVNSVGADEAWRLRRGAPSRLEWPNPSWAGPSAAAGPETSPAEDRLGAAAIAYGENDLATGDRELTLALRRDLRIAAAGIVLLEPSLGSQPSAERLVLYGDLLRAAGREREAAAAYDRAART
jgi:tetratricopeptide (TPR) repeat protein